MLPLINMLIINQKTDNYCNIEILLFVLKKKSILQIQIQRKKTTLVDQLKWFDFFIKSL